MNTRLHKSFLIPLSILLVLLLASCAESTYPGARGTVDARIETYLPMFSMEGSAEFYLNRFTKWEAESGGIDVSRPEFKITNHYTNDIFQNSSVEASIPYFVYPGTPAGKYPIKVTLYDAFGSESLVLTATLNVAESEQAYSKRLGTIQLIIGIVLLIAGIVVFFYARGSDSPDAGYLWMGILVLIGLFGIINGIRLLIIS